MGSHLQLDLVQDWNMSGHTWADVMGPISSPGIAIRSLHGGSKQPQNAINCIYVAINSPGGSVWVMWHLWRLEHVRVHLGLCVGTYFPTWNCHGGSPGWLKTAPKCHKLGICSHKLSRRFHMSTVTCIKAGTCQGTPGLVCWDFFPHLELPSGVSRKAQNGPKMP